MTTLAPILELAQGRPVCTSLNVAKHFGKQHKNVLRDIERIKTDLDENFNQLNFEPVDYLDAKGELRPAYQLTRDGFTLLAFGFTGKRALAWKVKYIQAFNAMEAEITRLRSAPALSAGLEERLARLELAAAGDAEELLFARFRQKAAAVLGPEAMQTCNLLAAQTFPHDDGKRRALEAQLINVQLTRVLNPRPRARRKPTNH